MAKNIVSENERKTPFDYTTYFRTMWEYQQGKLSDYQLLSLGRLGLHIWQTMHNPKGMIVRDKEITDKKIPHPFFALTEQGEMSGHLSSPDGKHNVDLSRYYAKDKPVYGAAYAKLEEVINHWQPESAGDINTWMRYWLVAHAYTFGLLEPGILGKTYRDMVGLGDDKKFAFILERVVDMSPHAIRTEWQEKVKAETEATKAAKTAKAKAAKAKAVTA